MLLPMLSALAPAKKSVTMSFYSFFVVELNAVPLEICEKALKNEEKKKNRDMFWYAPKKKLHPDS